MIGNTRVFVSSTCFDLDQIRADLKDALESIGHVPILSEYNSFPVSPSLDAIENCKKVVRENADLFVLIVGRKRGSLDPNTGKSIVNSEYQTAKRHQIDRFVFVNRQVLDSLPLWEKNPGADFSIYVDSPEVFAFLQRIKADEGWIFIYDRAKEIAETLRNQFSIYLKDLIQRKRTNKLSPLLAFIEETERSQYLALERPDYWEYLLTEELLRSKLTIVRNKLADIESGLVFSRKQSMRGKEFVDRIGSRLADLIALIKMLTILLQEKIVSSWGKPGISGDAETIKEVVDQIIDGCNELVSWEIEIRSLELPEAFHRIRDLMHGWAEHIITELERLPDELAKPFQNNANPEGTFGINLTFGDPPNLKAALDEIDRLQNTSYEWIDDF